MTPDLDDPLDDVLEAPLVIGPRPVTTIANGVKLAKAKATAHKLAAAEADLDRWLGKMLRAATRVDALRKSVRRYRAQIRKEEGQS